MAALEVCNQSKLEAKANEEELAMNGLIEYNNYTHEGILNTYSLLFEHAFA
jgi:hypothetical protein